MAGEDSQKLPTAFGFLLLDEFTMISMSSAIETLRVANRLSGTEVYRWTTLSLDGGPVTASDGVSVNAMLAVDDAAADHDAVIVCGGLRVAEHAGDEHLNWLKSLRERRIGLGSTCTGSYALAAAGLLDGYACSVQQDMIAPMTDRFPSVRVNSSIFTIDRDRYTSASGTAPMDMMFHFVRRQCGMEVSAGVAEQFVYERMRDPRELQRIALRQFVGKQSMKLSVAVDLMETNIRVPISQVDLASHVGLSRRQLQRLFQKFLFCSPSRYYLQLRLHKARDLLHQTDIGLSEVSAQTGFVANSHFSKCFKEYFGHSPSAERRLRTEARGNGT
jgi:transcriptional regulator GlxA family with amidase domain